MSRVIKPFQPRHLSEILARSSTSTPSIEVKHPIIREALQTVSAVEAAQIEITTLADIPAGTGLGSSGSFTTALLRPFTHSRATSFIRANSPSRPATSRSTFSSEPIGKQDQYIAAFGGITCFTFRTDGTVEAQPLAIDEDTRNDLEDNLLMFFTGYRAVCLEPAARSGHTHRGRTTAA